jgi:hypothetical protein
MWKTVLAAISGGLFGGAIVWYGQTATFHIAPSEMSYPEFSAILLTAVGVLVTVLGVFIAILAIWGYSQFRTIAQDAAKEHIGAQLKDGEIRAHIEEVVEKFLETDFKSGNLRKLIEERVDYVIFSGASQRADAAEVEEDEGLPESEEHE